jgi:glucose/mannose transport system substrate-binding protein
MKRLFISILILLVTVTFAFSGGQDETEKGNGDNAVEIWHFWMAGGEAEALSAVMDGFRENNPKIEVKDRGMPGADVELRQQLTMAFLAGDPPEVFQAGPAMMLKGYVENDRLTPLTDIWNEFRGDEIFPKDIAAGFKINGDVWGIPLNIHTENPIWYNVKVFKELNLEEPKTWEEYQDICDVLKENGIAPSVAAGAGWPVYGLFPFLIEALGPEGFNALSAGEISYTSPEVRRAFVNMKELWIDNLIDNWSGYGWADAARPFMEGKAGMYFGMGDWLAALLVSEGMIPGEEFDFFLPPAAGYGQVVLGVIDAFVMSKGSGDPALAKEFLKYTASVDGQIKFNTHKGSVSPNLEAPSDFYNPIMQKINRILKDENTSFVLDPWVAMDTDYYFTFTALVDKYAFDPTEETLNSVLNELENARLEMK